jgi:F-type H+-transporting ATPase subunit b
MGLEIDILTKLLPNPVTMIAQLGATTLLLFGFRKLLWKPMAAYIEKRAEAEDAALRNAKDASELAELNLARSEMTLNEAAQEAREIIEKGKLEGLRVKDKLLTEAKHEADGKLEAAQREIKHQRDQLRLDIESEIVDVALVAAKKLLESKVDEHHDRLAVQQIIKDVRN